MHKKSRTCLSTLVSASLALLVAASAPARAAVVTVPGVSAIAGASLTDGSLMSRLGSALVAPVARVLAVVSASTFPKKPLPASLPAQGAFSSLIIPVAHMPAANAWRGVRAEVNAGIGHLTDCTAAPCSDRAQQMTMAVQKAAALPFRQRLAVINATVNRVITYQADRSLGSSVDQWSSPRETLARGKGDCEDYALLKMAALRSLGFPEKSLSIVVVRVTDRNIFHAVLSVSTDQGNFILDNRRAGIALDSAFATYQPLYSVSGDRAWIHGRPRLDGEMASRDDLKPKGRISG